MKRGNKAQFYIIAAIIIVLILIGLVGVTNYIIVKEEKQEFFDLGEVLSREGDWAYNYAIYGSEDVSSVLDEFSTSFAQYVEENKEKFFDLVIVYGDINEAKAIVFSKQKTGGVEVNFGNTRIDFATEGELVSQEEPIVPDPDTGYINFTIGNYTYEGYLGENENFIFYMTTDEEFEKVVSTNIGQYQ